MPRGARPWGGLGFLAVLAGVGVLAVGISAMLFSGKNSPRPTSAAT